MREARWWGTSSCANCRGGIAFAALLILLCGSCSLALISRQCWLGLSTLLRIAASLLGLSNVHLRLGSVPVWPSIRAEASVDCDLERVMLIGQPGLTIPVPKLEPRQLLPRLALSAIAVATALRVYGWHGFSSGQPHIYAFGMAHRQEVAGSQTWSPLGRFASVLAAVCLPAAVWNFMPLAGIVIHWFCGHSSFC